MKKGYHRDLRRRRLEYERMAHGTRLRAVTHEVRSRVFFRLPPRWRMRVRPLVTYVLLPVVAGLAVAGVYAVLLAFAVGPVLLGVGTTVTLWLAGAVAFIVRHRRRTGYVAPPRSRGGGLTGVREPRRPPSGPPAASVALDLPVVEADPAPDATAGGTVLPA